MAELEAEADAARQGIRAYEDAVLAEAERQEKLDRLRGKTSSVSVAELAQRFPAFRKRVGGE
jgi:hypothetical protein